MIMGTRSTIRFIDKYGGDEHQVANIYQQYDGYIDGVGHELAEWLSGITIVNGIPYGETRRIANGCGCLAAQFIEHFKTEVGGLYMVEADNKQEYNYKVVINGTGSADETITIIVDRLYDWIKETDEDVYKEIFRGTPSELLKFKEKFDDDV